MAVSRERRTTDLYLRTLSMTCCQQLTDLSGQQQNCCSVYLEGFWWGEMFTSYLSSYCTCHLLLMLLPFCPCASGAPVQQQADRNGAQGGIAGLPRHCRFPPAKGGCHQQHGPEVYWPHSQRGRDFSLHDLHHLLQSTSLILDHSPSLIDWVWRLPSLITPHRFLERMKCSSSRRPC